MVSGWFALIAALASTVAFGNDAFFAAEVVEAQALPKLPTSPQDAAWETIAGRTFRLVPQRTVGLHDARSNQVLRAGPGSGQVLVKAAANARQLALYLEWSDATKEPQGGDEVNTYADSVAAQVPRRWGPGLRLPAIGMGDDDMHVEVTLLRASARGTQHSRFSAAGFGSLTRQAPAKGLSPNDSAALGTVLLEGSPKDAPAGMHYDEAQKLWRAVITLPVGDAGPGLVPVAFATWDGARGERAGYKRLSSWHFVRLPSRAVEAAWVKELAFGYHPGDLGEVERGRQLAEAACAGCHHFPGKTIAPEGLAPNLEAVGAIASPSYLRDSLVEPSKVILHELQSNQPWSTREANGRRVSKMPPFDQLSAGQIADVVAFLMSLEGERP